MNKKTSIQDSKLEALEKWRNAELDRAQITHARKQAVAAEKAQVVDTVQEIIDDSHNQVREQIAENRVISTESLTRLRHFTSIQFGELKQAQLSLDESKGEVAHAHATMQKKFEELAVVERLRKRRDAKADKEYLRQEQRRLDDQALLRSVDTSESQSLRIYEGE